MNSIYLVFNRSRNTSANKDTIVVDRIIIIKKKNFVYFISNTCRGCMSAAVKSIVTILKPAAN
jgi:hypothetical protein